MKKPNLPIEITTRKGWFVVTAIVLWFTSCLYFYSTCSTLLQVRLIVGVILGSVIFVPSLAGGAFFGWLVLMAMRRIQGLRVHVKAIAVLSPTLLLAIAISVFAYRDGQPATRFAAFFSQPLPESAQLLEMNGVYGIDGVMWSFSFEVGKSDLQTIIERDGYILEVDEKGDAFWPKRLKSRIDANWRVSSPFLTYVVRSNEGERRIFVGESGAMVHFVYCSK